MKKIIFILLGLVLAHLSFAQCACCSAPTGFSGGDVSPASYALSKGQMMLEMYGDIRFFNGMSSHQHADHMSHGSATPIHNMDIGVLGFRYGINSRWSLGTQLPYIYIGTKPQSSSAIGDAILLLNYNIYGKNGVVVATQLGIELPTGQLMQVDGLNSIATGSGSFDPLLGINLAKVAERSAFRMNVFYKHSTKGFYDTYYGDFLSGQLGYQYSLLKPQSVCGDSISRSRLGWTIVGQVSNEYLQSQFKEHAKVENTGSYTILASLGTGLSFKGISIPILFSVPVYQSLKGQQNQTQFRIRIGITKTFN